MPHSGLQTQGQPLLWRLPPSVDRQGAETLLRTIARAGSRRAKDREALGIQLAEWLAAPADPTPDERRAWESLAWAYGRSALAKVVPRSSQRELLDRLRIESQRAASMPVAESPLVHQWLAGELALVLNAGDDRRTRRDAARAAYAAIRVGWEQLLDTKGCPRARFLPHFFPLVACWTRCREAGERAGDLPWRGRATATWRRIVEHALRLSRPDRSPMLGDIPEAAPNDAWLCTAARSIGGLDGVPEAALVPPGSARARDDSGKPRLPKAAYHSEPAAVSVLRPSWARFDPRLLAVCAEQGVRLELALADGPLWSGVWSVELQFDNRPLSPTGPWEPTCWHSDARADYLELECGFELGVRVQRHLMLSRRGDCLLLADAVMAGVAGRLDYLGRLPLAPGVRFQAADETREGFLAGRRRMALVLPPALPEWRTDCRFGSLEPTGRGLELRQSRLGRALFAPLWFDLDPRRMKRPSTWRALTVAEDLAAVSPDVAVGYRVQAGSDQWLVYRSFKQPSNRTVLGHNLVTQFLAARFGRDGSVHNLIEIE